MSTRAAPTTSTITVRLPVDLIRDLDALSMATERNRNYWAEKAIAEVVKRELWQVREIEEAIAEDDADPQGGMTAEQLDAWLIENGLSTREAIDRAEERLRREKA